MKTTILHPATFKLDGGAMFGIIPKPLWEKKILADERNRIKMSLRVVLFESHNKKVLIDTGIGDYHSAKFHEQFDIIGNKSPLIAALQSIDISPDDITDIILTHLHFDHVGGLGQGVSGQDLIFKNATVHVHKDHYEYSKNPTLRDAGSFHSKTFLPLLLKYQHRNKLNFLEGTEGEIIKDGEDLINFKVSFGHTPYMLHPYTDKYIYMADLVPMEHHLQIPWVMGYDIEPGTTTKFKQKFYDFIQQKNLCMIFEHDNQTLGGMISYDEKSRPSLCEKIESHQKLYQILDD